MSSRPGSTGPAACAANSSGPAGHRGWKRVLLAGAALGMIAGLAGCGDTALVAMFSAIGLIGQPNYNTQIANCGKAVSATCVSGPAGVVATDGTVTYIVDSGNNRILGYMGPPPSSPTIAPDFVLGQTSFTASGLGTSASQLTIPSSVSIGVNASGVEQLVVADTGNQRVLIWNTLPTSNAVAADVVIGQTGFGAGNNRANNTSLTSSTVTSPVAGNTCAQIPQPYTNGSGVSNTVQSLVTACTLSGPTDAQIVNGQLFVVDHGNDRALIFESVPTANATPADYVMGEPDMASDQPHCVGTLPANVTQQNCGSNTNIVNFTNGPAQLNSPNNVWSDGFHLMVSDTGNNRVMYWAGIPTNNGSQANNVVGQVSFNTSNGANGSTGLRGPTGVSGGAGLLAGGSLAGFFVADTSNNRVLQYATFPTSNGLAASAVYGQSDFTHTAFDDDNQQGSPNYISNPQGGDQLYPSQRTLYAPAGVNVYGTTLYITDQGNNRIMEFLAQ